MKRAKKLFLKGFLLSLLLIGILGTIAVIVYGIRDRRNGMENEIPMVSRDSKDEFTMMEAVSESLSKNLIFSWDEESETIDRMVLEIYNQPKGKLNYITIPINIQMSISDHLYKSLLLVNPAIPQNLKINSLIDYTQNDIFFDVSARIVQDVLGITLSYYTVVPQKVYQNDFITKDNTDGISYEVLRKSYKKKLEDLNTEEKINDYVKSLYKEVRSNLKVDAKRKQLEGIRKIKLSEIGFEPLVGTYKNQGFIIDSVEVSKQLTPYLR